MGYAGIKAAMVTPSKINCCAVKVEKAAIPELSITCDVIKLSKLVRAHSESGSHLLFDHESEKSFLK